MKKKLLLILLCITAAVACSFGFAACNLFSNEESEHTHTITHYGEKAATCSVEGHSEYWYCNTCGSYFSDEKGENKIALADTKIPTLPHTEVVDAAVPKTCTTDGKTEGKHCSVCNTVTVEQQVVPAGHIEVIDKAVEATCTTDGKTQGRHCAVCSKVTQEQKAVPAHHTLVEDKGVEPTCTTGGMTGGKHCEKCDYTEPPTPIPANGHTEVDDKGKAATCTQSGLTDGKHCSVCNTVTVAQTVIPAKGHTEVTDAAVAATCLKDGKTAGKHCSVCGAIIVKQETVKASHNFGNDKICTVCGVHTASDGLEYTLSDDKKSYAVKGIGTCTDTVIYVADTYKGLPVTAVTSLAYNDKITKVVIPEGVTSIGDSAFRACYGLENVEIPSTVKTIGAYAFASCMKLEKIVIPEGVATIERETFDRCMAMTEITIPSTVKKIGERAFNVCNALKTVKYGASADEWNSIDIDKTDTYLNAGAKVGNYALIDAAKIYSSVGSGGLQYKYYDYHRDDYTGGGYSVVGIGSCTDSDVIIPATYSGLPVISIDSDAFKDCKTIKSVTTPDCMIYIVSSAFDNSSLETISISKSVTSVSYFFRAYSLKAVNVDSANAYYSSVDGVLYNKDKTEILCHPIGKKATSFSIASTVTSIGMAAFEYNSTLKTVTIPAKVSYIGIRAFRGCENLVDFTWPTALKHIDSGAFEDCKKLTQANMPDGIEFIGYGAFRDCANVSLIKLPDSLKFIEGQAFIGTAYYNNYNNWTAADGNYYLGEDQNDKSKHGLLYIGKHLIEVRISTDTRQIEIKEGTLSVASLAFVNCNYNPDSLDTDKYFIEVTVSDSVRCIPQWMFFGFGKHVQINIAEGSKWKMIDSGKNIGDYVYFNGDVEMSIVQTAEQSMTENTIGDAAYIRI